MLNDDFATRVFSTIRMFVDACGLPARQASLYLQALDRVEEVARKSGLFLPIDLPGTVAISSGLDDRYAVLGAAVATLLWAGADLMDDAADGHLVATEWDAQPAQLALIHTNLLATLPHLLAGDTAGAAFHRHMAEALLAMSLGQFSDLESSKAVQTSTDYLELVALKTGAEAAFFAAAPLMLAGAPEETCQAWSAFGFQIGCMAQVFSDVYGTFTTTSHNDLLGGKRTLPVLHTLERIEGAEREAFLADLDAAASGAAERLPDLFVRMNEHGAARSALCEVERLRFRAAAALPLELCSVLGEHPARRLLRCCSVLLDSLHARPTADKSAVPEGTVTAEWPGQRAPEAATDSLQAQRVADYYDGHTESFYLRLWDVDDIHFGLFVDREDSLRAALKAMTRAIVAPAVMRPGDFVVDAGCGVGGAALDLARDHGVRVLGLTVSERQVELARARAREAGLSDLAEFAVADCAERLPLADGSVDIVLTIEAACHFADRARFVAECHRVLRPGGRLVGSDWVRIAGGDDMMARTALAAVEKAWRLSSLASTLEWQRQLEECGFYSVLVEDFGTGVMRNASLLAGACRDLLLEAAQSGRDQPHHRLWIEQCTTLCEAWMAGWFSVARFEAVRL